jgi:hypothetical protein
VRRVVILLAAIAVAVEIALLAKLLLDPWVQQGGTPSVLFFTHVISAVFGGLGSGLLATFVATLASLLLRRTWRRWSPGKVRLVSELVLATGRGGGGENAPPPLLSIQSTSTPHAP